MTQAHPTIAAVRRRRRPWRTTLAICVLLVAGTGGGWWYLVWAEERDFTQALAETDRGDPGWRFEEMEAARLPVPDAENAALVVINATAGLMTLPVPKLQRLFGNLTAEAPLTSEEAAEVRRYLDQEAKRLATVRALSGLCTGRFPAGPDPAPVSSTNAWCMRTMEVLALLWLDALVQIHDGDGSHIADSCCATINAARSMGDPATIMEYLVYVAGMEYAGLMLHRVLAHASLTAKDLKLLQERIESEIDAPRALSAMRGERAWVMKGLESPDPIGGNPTRPLTRRTGWRDWFIDWLPASATRNRANGLRTMNELIEASRLPLEEHLDAVQRIGDAHQHDDAWTIGLVRSMSTVVGEEARIQARLRSLVVALAAERYRQDRGDWPVSLDALVETAYLKAVPVDPYGGGPLRYRRLADGAVFYSVGADRIDNDGNLNAINATGARGTDEGCRLWDPGVLPLLPR
jgi:hypothetical protein